MVLLTRYDIWYASGSKFLLVHHILSYTTSKFVLLCVSVEKSMYNQPGIYNNEARSGQRKLQEDQKRHEIH